MLLWFEICGRQKFWNDKLPVTGNVPLVDACGNLSHTTREQEETGCDPVNLKMGNNLLILQDFKLSQWLNAMISSWTISYVTLESVSHVLLETVSEMLEFESIMWQLIVQALNLNTTSMTKQNRKLLYPMAWRSVDRHMVIKDEFGTLNKLSSHCFSFVKN